MQPPLRTNRQFIAIYSAAITANAPSRVFNTVLHETRNTGLEGGKGEGRGQKLARNGSRQTATAACRPAVSSLICLQSAKRAVSYLFPLNSLHRFIYTNIYIYTSRFASTLSSLPFSSLIIFQLGCCCSTSNRSNASSLYRFLLSPFLFSRVILVNGEREEREIVARDPLVAHHSRTVV